MLPAQNSKKAAPLCTCCGATIENPKHIGRPRSLCDVCLYPPRSCKQCKKEFRVVRTRAGNNEFCSRKCCSCWNVEHPRNTKTIAVCLACNKEFYSYPSKLRMGWDKFCSWACRVPYMKEHGMSGPTNRHSGSFDCIECGKTVKACVFDSMRRQFCNPACYGKYVTRTGKRRKDRLTLSCAWCGRDFQKLPSQVKSEPGSPAKPRFCSMRCVGYFGLSKKKKTRVSKIENFFFDMLQEYDLEVERQFKLGVWTIDGVIEKDWIAVEFDGAYWHGKHPGMKDRDARKDESLRKSGFRVVRVGEADFTSNPKRTLDRVSRTIKKLQGTKQQALFVA